MCLEPEFVTDFDHRTIKANISVRVDLPFYYRSEVDF